MGKIYNNIESLFAEIKKPELQLLDRICYADAVLTRQLQHVKRMLEDGKSLCEADRGALDLAIAVSDQLSNLLRETYNGLFGSDYTFEIKGKNP